MEFETWSTPLENGTVWLVDLSWGTESWSLEKPDGTKYEIPGVSAHRNHDLVARVFHEETEALYKISFNSVNGFRCLDEHGLTEIWNSKGQRANSFMIKKHGWHKESPLTFFMGNENEWSHLVVTSDEWLEVVCRDTPTVEFIENVPLR